MGKVANSAVRDRRRRRVEELAAAIADRDASYGGDERAQRRRRVAVAEVRRAVRARLAAEAAMACADQRAAAAVWHLTDQGLTQPDIAATCGLPVWTVRRLLALSKASADTGDAHPD